MPDILTAAADYNALRFRLGVTTDDLPDAEITSLALLEIAEALVKQLVTDWATIMGGTTVDRTFLRTGTLALVAAFATRKLELQRGQSFTVGGHSESATKMSWSELRAELMQECQSLFLMISTHVPTSRPRLLIASGPTSSGSTWPTLVSQWVARVEPHLVTWLDTNGVISHGWENHP